MSDYQPFDPSLPLIINTQKTYTFVKFLGRGNSGTIWQAKTNLNEAVAIKIIDAENDKYQKDIDREISILKMLSTIRHPSIIWYKTHHVKSFESYQLYFIVTECLIDYVDLYSPKEWTKSIKIINDIGSAIQTLHSNKIIHGDLSTSNIMVNSNFTSVKVIDFGFSYLDTDCPNAKVGGTYDFLPPEQLGVIDKINPSFESLCKSDLWSFGQIIYVLLEGTTRTQMIPESILWTKPMIDQHKVLFTFPLDIDLSQYRQYATYLKDADENVCKKLHLLPYSLSDLLEVVPNKRKLIALL